MTKEKKQISISQLNELTQTHNLSQAAKILGMNRTALEYHCKKLGIKFRKGINNKNSVYEFID